MDIEHISVSRQSTWGQCRALYKFKYHLRLPSPEVEPPYFAYGKIVHKAIELHTQSRGKADIRVIVQDILSGKIDLEPGKKAHPLDLSYKKKLPEHLRSYLKLAERIGYDGEIEWPFLYDLDPPHGLCAKGFIDRLIVRDPDYFIIDYKTTKRGPWRKTPENITSDLQLQMYARVVQKKFGADPSRIKAALYYLDGAQLVAAKFSEETLENAEKFMLGAYRDIVNASPESVVGNPGPHCERCEYRRMCPFYKPKPWDA